jgi:hypothetical protein
MSCLKTIPLLVMMTTYHLSLLSIKGEALPSRPLDPLLVLILEGLDRSYLRLYPLFQYLVLVNLGDRGV